MRFEKLDCTVESRDGKFREGPWSLLSALPRMRALGPGHRVVRRDGCILAWTGNANWAEMVAVRLANNEMRRSAV